MKKFIAVNSTLSFVIAFLLTTFLHELAHAVVGLLYNSSPVLHHNFVVHYNISSLEIYQKVLIAFAGPFISLIQGLAVGLFLFKKRKRGALELFLLWFSILGLFNFLGYIFTAPIFAKGDIGKIFSLLEVVLVQQIIFSLMGASGLLYVAYKITTPFLSFCYEVRFVESGKNRQNFSLHILIIPWLLGSTIVTILYLPIVAMISIFYPIMSGFIFIYPWRNANRAGHFVLSQDKSIGSFSKNNAFAFIAIVLIFKIVLAAGIEF